MNHTPPPPRPPALRSPVRAPHAAPSTARVGVLATSPEDTAPPFRWTGELPQWIDSDVFQINGAWFALQINAAPVTNPVLPPPPPGPGPPPQWLGVQSVVVNGRLYALQLYLLPIQSGPPPPPPPPPVGVIKSIMSWNGVALSAGRPGDFVLINGSGFGAAPGGLTVAGIAVTGTGIHRWNDAQVAFFVPANGGPDVAGPVIVTPSGGAGILSPGSFTVAGTGPAPAPRGGQPHVDGFFDGQDRPLSSLPANLRVSAKGGGFGPVPGEIWWAGLSMPVVLMPLSWSDSTLSFLTPTAAARPGGWLMIRTADGRWGDWALP